MLAKTVVLGLIMAASGCSKHTKATSPRQVISPMSECEQFLLYVKQHWVVDDQGVYNFVQPIEFIPQDSLNEFSRRVYKNCFVGMNKEEIVAIFGKPSKVLNNRFDYYMRAKCYDNTYEPRKTGCVRMKVYFGSDSLTVAVLPGLGIE